MTNDKIYHGMMVYSRLINRIGWLEEIIDLDHYLIRWNNNMTWLVSKNNLIKCHQYYLDLEKKNG